MAQSKLGGYVTEQNSGKKSVAEVLVTSAGAHPIASSSLGKFILTYHDFGVGKNVVVRAEKDGWELVNDKEMSTLIPANPDEKPLKIVVCKAGTLAQAKKAYHTITDDYLLKEYNRKMAALNRQKAGWQQEAAKLDAQLQQLQKQLDEMADEFSRVNLDDATAIERQAIELFKAGKIDESIQLRESLKSDEEIKKAVKQKANADSTIALHTRNLIELARGYSLKFDFVSAENTYQKLVEADTTNFTNLFEFAYFLQGQNQHEKAIRYYEQALKLAKTEPLVARTQNNLGILYKDKNDFASALNAYQRALDIYEQLAKTNPATYEPRVASTQNNLGILYQAKNDFASALNAYQRALDIRERLAKTNPATYEPDVAMTQNNLGNLYQAKNDFEPALKAYQRALDIYERLAKTNPATYEPLVARTQNNLGSLYQAKNELDSALNAYQRALDIYERLAKTNPDAFEIELCRSIVLLGFLQKANYQSARQPQIAQYLSRAKQLLPKYNQVPLAQKLLNSVDELQMYFTAMKP